MFSGQNPQVLVAASVRAEARTYLRGNSNHNDKNNGQYWGLSTAAAKCAASGRDDDLGGGAA